MDTLAKRFRYAREESGLSKSELARVLEISATAVTLIENGKSQGLRASTAAKLERATGFSSNWVVTGKGQKKRSSVGADSDPAQLNRILEGLKSLSEPHRRKIEAEIEFYLSLKDA